MLKKKPYYSNTKCFLTPHLTFAFSQSFDSFCFPADLTSTHRTPDASTASKNASTELQLQALQRELNRTRLVFSELLSAQDAEILRLTDLLNNAGLDGDGNPLPTGADLYTDAL